jgi:two-component system sensor histidine kinase TctE
MLLLAPDVLRAALGVAHGRSLRTLAALAQQRDQIRVEQERRHDALNALASIRTAGEVLAWSTSQLDDDARADLAQAARAELSRVERLLAARGPVEHAAPLDAVLAPLLHTWRHRGLDVRLDGLQSVWLPAGLGDDLRRIVDNLLQNAARYAAGAPVRISAVSDGETLRLELVDAGPGVPLTEQATLFLPGLSDQQPAAGDPAHGLGLTSARRLARTRGGDLQLLRTVEGAAFALTLPLTAQAGPVPAQQVG